MGRKEDCEEYDGIWVPGYYKKNGIKVKSYCRSKKGCYFGTFSGFTEDWDEDEDEVEL